MLARAFGAPAFATLPGAKAIESLRVAKRARKGPANTTNNSHADPNASMSAHSKKQAILLRPTPGSIVSASVVALALGPGEVEEDAEEEEVEDASRASSPTKLALHSSS
jgi:hypothetical protein